MTLLFPAPAAVLAPVTDGRSFPVRRLFCIGRNYAAHAREMGRDPDREEPFFFTKWAETVVLTGGVIRYPSATNQFHYEAELVVALHQPGRNIPTGAALDHVFGFACGLDMTRRDLQLQARDKGRPWDAGKNFEQSAPLGPIHPALQTGAMDRGRIALTHNGVVRQGADLSDMIWSVPEVISYLSRYYQLEAGDLIFTGTPAGVGPVVPGDSLKVTIEGLPPCEVSIGSETSD